MRGFLETKQLRYFRAVAANGSLSGAARALHIAQPALSYHIAELEGRIGTRLLHRHRNGVSLTAAGDLLLQYAIRIGELAEQAESELLSAAGRGRGRMRLRLAIISSLAAAIAPAVALGAAEKLPSAMLRISETSTMDSLRLMEQGEIDAAIHLIRPEGLECRPLAFERLFFASRADPMPAMAPLNFADLAQTKLVLPARGNPLRDFLEKKAVEAGIKLQIAFEIDGWAPRRNAIRAGLGSTIFGAHSVVRESPGALMAIRPIVAPALRRPIYLCIRPELDRRLARQLQEMLQAVISRPEFQFDDDEEKTEEACLTAKARCREPGEELAV